MDPVDFAPAVALVAIVVGLCAIGAATFGAVLACAGVVLFCWIVALIIP